MFLKNYRILCIILTGLCAFVPAAGAIGGEQGWIEIRCNVDGASVSFDGEYKGQTANGVLTVPVYTTGAPYSTYTVEKTGYYPASGSIRMPAAGETQTYYATLQYIPTPVPEPQYGSIYVESSPSGAAIYLNGNYRGVAPLTISDVRAGSYSVEADLSGYNSYSTVVTVSSGGRSNVYCPLSRIITTGSLYITSSPSDAHVYLDGNYRGRTPLSLNTIASGTHIVEMDLSGYYDWKSTENVPQGGTRTVSATLNPIPVSTNGWIYVSSTPGGATVLLDGRNAGQTPATGSLKLDAVAGDHTIALNLAGYSDYSTNVRVTAATTSQVAATLVPAGSSSSTGVLAVSSSPAGANVLLDNNFMGITPLTLPSVSTGSHNLQIQMAGYQEYLATVQVNAGATNTVSAALNPATVPTQKSGMLPVAAGFAVLAIGFVAFLRQRK